MRILIADDDATSRRILERTLSRAGHETETARDGMEALEKVNAGSFDLVLTDWMMPRMDGIELTRRIRMGAEPIPPVLIVTALAHAEAREWALDAGADDYLAKPILAPEVLARVDNCLSRSQQDEVADAAPVAEDPVAIEPASAPPFPVACIAASTGGPPAITQIFENIHEPVAGALFVVVHAPGWMLDTFASRLQRACRHVEISMAEDGTDITAGRCFIAPGDRHLVIDPESRKVRLTEDPPENFVRPAADPLFRSAAASFGRYAIGMVLTGMGRDATQGADAIAKAGGRVIAQDPATAVARSMPEALIRREIAQEVVDLPDAAPALVHHLREMSKHLATISAS